MRVPTGTTGRDAGHRRDWSRCNSRPSTLCRGDVATPPHPSGKEAVSLTLGGLAGFVDAEGEVAALGAGGDHNAVAAALLDLEGEVRSELRELGRAGDGVRGTTGTHARLEARQLAAVVV